MKLREKRATIGRDPQPPLQAPMPDLVNVVIPPLRDPFTYRVPDGRDDIQVGCQIEVSFGRRHATGFVVKRFSQSDLSTFPYELKLIDPSQESVPSFLPEQLPFLHWIADYYCEPLSSVLDVAIPAPATGAPLRTVKLIGSPDTLRGKRERDVVDFLSKNGGSASFSDLTRALRGSGATIHRLTEKQIVEVSSTERLDLPFLDAPPPSWTKSKVDLSEHQQRAVECTVDMMTKGSFAPILLHGVTGSGKTEVYIEAIKHAIAMGRGALVIVPEIALTPQLIDRFRARLNSGISVLHSAMSKRHRWNSWRALLEGRTTVAIGARSGLFAPLRNLGLMIVDEEHDSSYKQNEGLRYHARDLALVLGKLSHCPVMLGSATPSLESFHNATSNRYHYLSLPSKYSTGAPINTILVDMNRLKPWDMASKHISPQLHTALGETIARGEQAFLLYNRRGFANYLQCERCEEVLRCENCSVTLTHHRSTNSLVCHYCNLSLVVPSSCPTCPPHEESAPDGKEDKKVSSLVERGGGTERIFDEVKELFPNVSLERLDRDSASDHHTYRAILDRLRSGEIQVLVGTQMIAKGHDLPRVTLMGVVDCDVGLHLPDFRAAERVYQLLTQAAGRCGRAGTGGTVVLQTRVPNHASLVKTVLNDYRGFAEIELGNRRHSGYPPFTKIVRIVVASQDRALPPQILQRYKQYLLEHRSDPDSFQLLGPSTTPIERIKTLWRCHLLIKSSSPSLLNSLVRQLQSIPLGTNKAKVIFDVDPQDML